jgi:hypothetical protein
MCATGSECALALSLALALALAREQERAKGELPSLYRERARRVNASAPPSHWSSHHPRSYQQEQGLVAVGVHATSFSYDTAVRILQRSLEAGDWPLCSTRLHARGRACCPYVTQSIPTVLRTTYTLIQSTPTFMSHPSPPFGSTPLSILHCPNWDTSSNIRWHSAQTCMHSKSISRLP